MKLVLFDIDGTLIKPLRPFVALQRVSYAAKKIFDISIPNITPELWKEKNYNGKGDRYIFWDLIKHDQGITRDMFLDRIGDVGNAYAEYLDQCAQDGPLYEPIVDAATLLNSSIQSEQISVGLLTGNLSPSAHWKMRHAKLPDISFGVFGDEADERNDLARLVIPKAQSYYQHTYAPNELYIIGDTVHDVTCARAIGATAIVVSTGWNVHKNEFENTPPDLHVDSLMDERVLKLLGL